MSALIILHVNVEVPADEEHVGVEPSAGVIKMISVGKVISIFPKLLDCIPLKDVILNS